MKTGIIIGLLFLIIFYLVTQTKHLDPVFAKAKAYQESLVNKLKSISGTTIVKRSDDGSSHLLETLVSRLSKREKRSLSNLMSSEVKTQEFLVDYCFNTHNKHPVFTQENLQMLCRHL